MPGLLLRNILLARYCFRHKWYNNGQNQNFTLSKFTFHCENGLWAQDFLSAVYRAGCLDKVRVTPPAFLLPSSALWAHENSWERASWGLWGKDYLNDITPIWKPNSELGEEGVCTQRKLSQVSILWVRRGWWALEAVWVPDLGARTQTQFLGKSSKSLNYWALSPVLRNIF